MKQIHFSLANTTPINLQDFDTLILPVYEDGSLPAQMTDDAIQAIVKSVIDNGDFKAKPASTLMLVGQKEINRICLVGVGEKDKITDKSYIDICNAVAKEINQIGSKACLNLITTISSLKSAQGGTSKGIFQASLAMQKSQYDYVHPSRVEHKAKKTAINSMCFWAESNTDNKNSLTQAQATANGMNLTQDLANMPSNFCTPTYLAETANKLAEEYGFDCNILEREQMLAMGMGAFMSVAQGGDEPPKMICLHYKGSDNKDDAPIALVGKGVTFDSGGISLKPGAGMDEMKYDMGGSATVLGVFKALGELKPNINVVAVIPSTENMPSGDAIKPGDVVTSLSGQTIEILNTDAEGRLILCDALTYVQDVYKPKQIIDMATLTGACIIALGHHISAVLGNNQPLVDDLLAASQSTYDRFWQMPLSDEYDEQLKSNFADMANIGGRAAGTITAAQFLARFVKDVDWAHLDIAGTAWTSGANKGATGRPVPALVEFLLNKAK